MEDPDSSWGARLLHYTIVCLIATSTVLAILQTEQSFAQSYAHVLDVAEVTFTAGFTLEILARLWTTEGCCLRFCTNLSNIVDVLGTLPWYLEMCLDWTSHDGGKMVGPLKTLRCIRVIRTVRIMRLAKAVRYSEVMSSVFESMWDSLEGMSVVVLLVGMGSITTAAVAYGVESEDLTGEFDSIPSAMWWSLATITTVGYGDAVPSTSLGKVVACVAMVVGTIIMAVSAATITTSFTETYNKKSAMAKMAKSNKGLHRQGLPRPLEEEDLASTFAALEGKTKEALTRLELALKDMTGGAMTLQVMHSQCEAMFRSATQVADQVAETGAQKPDPE